MVKGILMRESPECLRNRRKTDGVGKGTGGTE